MFHQTDTYTDYDFIVPGLAQGGQPPQGATLHQLGFDAVVLAAEEFQPSARTFPGVQVIHVPYEDGPNVPVEVAMKAAQQIARLIRSGKQVLVTCYAGLNRSGLLVALTLWYLGFGSGLEIVSRVRAGRVRALSNPWFAAWLRTLPPRRVTRTRQTLAGCA
jgi:hypothetical protein